MKPSADRGFLERLEGELHQIRDGLARLEPDRNWDPIVLKGKLGALGSLVETLLGRGLAGTGLSSAEQQVLGILRSGSTANPSDLARITNQTRAGMSRTIDRMVARGLVDRSHDTADRRRVTIVLTPRGRRLADRKVDADMKDLEALFDGLDGAGLRKIEEAVDDLVARLAGICATKNRPTKVA